MEKPSQEQLQQQQQGVALKCPRCDSSNTKFCYYNNYSLSQPRHFCKACKRYWTRGGTLRNVPVGGGCRKNKRVKRPSTAAASATTDGSGANSSSSSSANNNSNPGSVIQPQIDLASTSHMLSPLFYGLPSNPNTDMSRVLPFSRFSSTTSGYDLHDQPQLINALGLGFSSSPAGVNDSDHHYQNGFSSNPTKNIQDIVSSNSLLSSCSSIFSASNPLSSAAGASPTIASLLASKFTNGGLKDSRGPINHFQPLSVPFDDLHIAAAANGGEAGNLSTKHVKLEDGQGRLDWSTTVAANCQNQTEQISLTSSDPSLYWNPAAAVGTNWHDPANSIGSSVPSLI